MKDANARLAAKLALAESRNDWWNVYSEHTAPQWAAQVARFEVEPWGDDRDDMRSAILTANLMAMNSAKPMSESQFSDLVQNLRCYLKVNEPAEQIVGPAQAARIAGAR